MQTKQSPVASQIGALDTIGTHGLFNTENIDVNNERYITKYLTNAANSLQIGGALKPVGTDEVSQRNDQIIRGAIGWYMLVKVVLQQPTIMRLMSLPNVEGLIREKGIRLVSPNGLETFDSEQTVQHWLNIIYIDVTGVIQTAEPLSNSLGETYRNFVEQAQRDTMRRKEVAPSDTLTYMNIERLSFFFEMFVIILKDKFGASEGALLFNNILMVMQKWMKQIDFAGSLLDTIQTSLAANASWQTQTESNILTYVRLTTRPPNLYNRRFDVRVSPKDQNVLYVGYRNDDIKYYGDDLRETPEFRQLAETNKQDFENRSEDIVVHRYPYRYLFGPFTRVLLPNVTNQECATQCVDILKALKNKQSVLLIGYGASGAGKTSSLVYLNNNKVNKVDRDGVLIHLCHHSDILNQYDEIQVSVVEIYVSDTDTQYGESTKRMFEYKSSEPVGRERRDKLTLTKNQENKFAVADDVVYRNAVISGEVPLQNLEMGEVVLHLLDRDRRVSATTNNPVSSRSHVLIFVRLCQKEIGDSAPYLIVGDFAGVENKFDCKSWDVLNKFRKSGRLVDGAIQKYYDQVHEGDNCLPQTVPKFTPDPDVNLDDLEIYLNNTPSTNGEPIVTAYEEMQANMRSFGQQSEERFVDFPNYPENQENVRNLYSVARIKEDDKWILLAMIPNLYLTDAVESLDIYQDPNRPGELRQTDFITKFSQQVETFFSQGKPTRTPLALQAAYLLAKLVPFAMTNNKITLSGQQNKDVIAGLLDDLRFLPNVASQNVSMFGVNFQDLQQYAIIFSTSRPTNYHEYLIDLRRYIQTHQLFSLYKGLSEKKSLPNFLKNLFLMRRNLMQRKFEMMSLVMGTTMKFHQAKKQLQQYFQHICNCRTREGMFINNSLKDTRNVIAALIVKQSQERKTIRVIPPFFDTCMYMQCRPLSGSCYNSYDAQTKVQDSAMFKAIKKQFETDRANTSLGSLKIAIFSVLNLSRDANNPPPTPYIDIEDIKLEMDRIAAAKNLMNVQVSAHYEEVLRQECPKLGLPLNTTSPQELLTLLKQLLQQDPVIEFDSSKIDTDFETASLTLAEAYTRRGNQPAASVAHAIGCIAVERKFLTIAKKFHQCDEQSLNKEQLDILLKTVVSFTSKMGTDLVNKITYLITDLKQRYDNSQASDLVLLIDNYNATSALGTLEFTDRMAKYAMTDKTCRISDSSPQYIRNLDTSMKRQVSSLTPIAEASRY